MALTSVDDNLLDGVLRDANRYRALRANYMRVHDLAKELDNAVTGDLKENADLIDVFCDGLLLDNEDEDFLAPRRD